MLYHPDRSGTVERDSRADLPLWEQFEKAARARRRNPVRLLTEYMRECLESWEDQQLDEEISEDLRGRGHTEEEAVELVRRHRQDSAAGHAPS
jgi:hypothetical protein